VGQYPEAVDRGKLKGAWRVQGTKEWAGTRKQLTEASLIKGIIYREYNVG